MDGCRHYHHVLLHTEGKREFSNRREDQAVSPSHDKSTPPVDGAGPMGMSNAAVIEGTDGPLMILPVKMKKANGKGTITVYGMLDNGATHSMILKSLVKDLGIKLENSSILASLEM